MTENHDRIKELEQMIDVERRSMEKYSRSIKQVERMIATSLKNINEIKREIYRLQREQVK